MYGTAWIRRGPAGEWIARLTERLADVRAEIRRSIVEAVSRTAAEAAEGTLVRLVGRWQFPAELRWADAEPPPPPVYGPRREFYDEPEVEEPEELAEPEERVAPPKRRWRTILVAALHGLAWLLPRQCTSPAVATAAALVGAVVLLLD